jgi:diguanylate cyclase (GGDEF)-like protein
MRPLWLVMAGLLAGLLGVTPLGVRAAAPAMEVQFRSVSVPQSSVPTITQDRAGFIWVATSKGVTRYDGYRLRPIELPGETAAQRGLGWVRAMAPSADGRMWIGTEFQGLVAYDPERDKVEVFGSAAGAGERHAPIRALAEGAQGDIWVGTLGSGLLRFTPATRRFEAQTLLSHGEPETRVLALLAARDGRVWAGHWRGLAMRLDGAWVDQPLPGLDAGTPVLALAETRDGRVWFGTQDGRLGVVEAGRLRWVQTDLPPVQALAEAPDGRLWVGTKRGLLWVNASTGVTETLLRHDPRFATGLAGNDVSALLQDHSGAMWVSGYGLGVQRHLWHPALAVRGPDADPTGPLADPDVRAVLALRQAEVLAATQTGTVVRLDARPGQGLATLGLWPRERRSVVETLGEAEDGSLWLAAAGRLEHRSLDGRLLRDWPLDGGRAQRLLPRADGSVWLAMQEGLYRLPGPDASALERMHPANGPRLLGAIHALIEDRPSGGLWIGGQQGLWRWRAGQLEPVGQVPGRGLASPVVVGLLQARDGTLWVDTPVSGLHHLRGWDAQGRAAFDRISERHGLEGIFGGNLHEDAQGRIWTQLNVYDPKLDRADSFGAAEGAFFGSFWFFASTELRDGSLLFGGSRGLLRVQPSAFTSPQGSLPVVISAVRVDGQPYHPPALQAGLRLPAGTRSLGVEFAALAYAEPTALRYQYRLQGLDTDWTSVDASARNPSFSRLKPGHYTLEVRASAHPTLWSQTLLELPIDLEAAWWQTLWAQLGAGVLGALAVWGLVQWRTAALRRNEQALQLEVDARTATLRELSFTDALTGLHNRRYLELQLDDDLRLCLRRFEQATPPSPDSDVVVMLLDLDRFKQVNDAHGHAAGDAVLVQLAQRLRRVCRDTDALVRWGGEEVLVLMRGTRREDAADLAARIGAVMREQPFDIGTGRPLTVTVSIGFAAFPLDPARPRAWDWRATLALADSALYAAKEQGRDGFVGAVQARDLPPSATPHELAEWERAVGLEVRRGIGPR